MKSSNYPKGFPHGLTVQGLPILNTYAGEVFWVGNNTTGVSASNQNKGQTPKKPFSTIDYAVGRCLAGRGDIIMVMPGHNESITSATSLVVDVAGVSVVGLGNGRNRPILDFDNTASSVEMDAANTRFSNIICNASVSAVVVGINVDADDVTLDHLEFTLESSTGGDDFLLMIDIDAFDRAIVDSCDFRADTTAVGASIAIRIDDSHYSKIVNNSFMGKWSTSAIVGEGDISLSLLISNNQIYNADTGVSNGIDLNVACTGIISYNAIATLQSDDIALHLDPGSCLCIENYAVNAVDESGGLVPIAVST